MGDQHETRFITEPPIPIQHTTNGRAHGTSEPWFPKRRASSVGQPRRESDQRRSSVIERSHFDTRWWKFTLAEWDDEQEADWWFAGTAIPLLAATLGPLANVLSICALVTSWRMCLVDGVSSENAAQCLWNGDTTALVGDISGTPFDDPRWCYWINVVSLIMGFVGNLFLLLNFTGRVRYIIALPVTIAMWYIATGLLIGITVSMQIHVPPVRPEQTYTQGFWHGVLAAIMYLICSMLLMINMLGYFLGHYPERFNLTDSQRTLILQTMMFFIWLGGGGAVFSRIETEYGEGLFDWSFVNAVYFCDVTILTVGFGDLYVTSNVGRGLIFPYSVGGIITLGLMISSISKFAGDLGADKVVEKHMERSRMHTIGRTVTSSMELERSETMLATGERPVISGPIAPVNRSTTLKIVENKEAAKEHGSRRFERPLRALTRASTFTAQTFRPKPAAKSRLILLREERDRFNAMRDIQHKTEKWKRWTALSVSVTAFGILWCIGAVVFWRAEHEVQGMTYFEALYFCYVSLLTIGYGDFAPKSNLGRPFFIVWSLIAVPTMTILISDMGDTIINNFDQGTNKLAEFTIMPEQGTWRNIVHSFPWLERRLQARKARMEAEKRLAHGFETGPEDDRPTTPTINQLAADEPSDYELARKLAQAIRKVASDLKENDKQQYNYEEWVQFTRLIKFTSRDNMHGEHEEEEDQIEWDWIGADSPMMARQSEAEFVLDRLCESMGRYIRRITPPDTDSEMKPRPRDRSADRSGLKSRNRSISPSSPQSANNADIEKFDGFAMRRA